MKGLSETKREEIGYLKYSGKLVEDGFMDARKSAEALLGFDEILRYFLSQEKAILGRNDFEVPVRIKKGSWEMIVSNIVGKLLSPQGIGTAALMTYATITAKKAAEDGVSGTGISKDIKSSISYAIKSAQWVIKIGLHIGTLTKKRFEKAKINIEKGEVLIPNDKGEMLIVPKKYFDIYVKCPARIFSKSASVIEKDRALEFGLYEEDKENEVCITENEKGIFYKKEDEDELLFPELEHGKYVELEGEITRVTESTNSLGFRYNEHVLICNPQSGTVAQFKEVAISEKDHHFFPKVKVFGVVSRMKDDGELNKKKPRIIISKIESLEVEEVHEGLF